MIRTYLILTLLVLVTFPLLSKNYKQVDEKVKTYPKSFSNLDKLAGQINKDFKKPEEKARAIYAWIAMNVSYDVKGMNNTKSVSYSYRSEEEKEKIEKKMEEDLALKTMKQKKAVCQGYSTLYKILCEKTALECEIISGTSKTTPQDIGKAPGRMDHAWNAIKLNGKWKLVDATWGAGYMDQSTGKFKKIYSDFYFLTDPDKFFLKHYPEDKKWLLTNKTAKDFTIQPLYYRNYFESDLEIVEPMEGEIKMPKNKIFKLAIKNCKDKNVIISMANGKNVQQISPTSKKSICYYEYTLKGSGFLNVYVNNEAIVTYKIFN
ncbi:MAG: transglutaminase domain-containing protein [Bacteroidales bacterium]|nr:transglutaminase domain-containing protein [Bacteroidales bacterium]